MWAVSHGGLRLVGLLHGRWLPPVAGVTREPGRS
jgi:hypothetical protein